MWVSEDCRQQVWEIRRVLAFVVARRPLDLGRYLKRELVKFRQLCEEMFWARWYYTAGMAIVATERDSAHSCEGPVGLLHQHLFGDGVLAGRCEGLRAWAAKRGV